MEKMTITKELLNRLVSAHERIASAFESMAVSKERMADILEERNDMLKVEEARLASAPASPEPPAPAPVKRKRRTWAQIEAELIAQGKMPPKPVAVEQKEPENAAGQTAT